MNSSPFLAVDQVDLEQGHLPDTLEAPSAPRQAPLQAEQGHLDTLEAPSAPRKGIQTSYRASAGEVLAPPKRRKVKRPVQRVEDLETGEVTGESSSSYLQVESFDKAVQAMARQWSPEENDKKKVTFEEGKPTDEKVSSLKHGKFSTDGRLQEFVYIPTSEFTDIAAKSSDLFDTILRHWNLPRPQLLIKFQSGFAHPKHLLGKDEIEKFRNVTHNSSEQPEICKYFEHFKEFQRQKQPSDSDDMDDEELENEALKLLNEFLFKSLSNLIDVIVRAAVRNRCWILVEGGPNGGLLLLKHAAERCNERPVILVLDALQRKRFPYPQVEKKVKEYVGPSIQTLDDLVKLEASNDSAEAKKAQAAVQQMKEKMLEEAWEKHEKMLDKKRQKDANSPAHKATEGRRPSLISKKSLKSTTSSISPEEQNWKPEDQQEVEDTRMESALMTARLLRHAKPIDKPDMDPLKLGAGFWNAKLEKDGWACQSSKSLESGKVRWNHWHFRGGTHYIFTDDDTTELLTDCLAPSGCIFLGGGDGSKKELMKMLINGEPVVCLDNTGRLTQDFVASHNYLCKNLFKDAAETADTKKQEDSGKTRYKKERSLGMSELQTPTSFLPQENTDFLKGDIARKTVFRTLTFDGLHGAQGRNDMVESIRDNLRQVTSFTQPELCELFLTYLRRGLQITKLCVVMDPLNPRECSGGHTEDKLSMCLSNFVILASNDTSDFADVEAVKAASCLEEQLLGAAAAERWWAVCMTYMLLALNFFSLLLALARNSTAPYFLTWMPPVLLRWGLPGVSAASTFISGLVGRFRFTLRWSKARSAAAHLEAEIWKFRTRVSDYVVVGSREDDDGANRMSELGQAFTRERKQDVTRSVFRSNVTNIFNTAMEEMGTSSLHGHGFDRLPSAKKKAKLPLCCCARRQRDEGRQSPKETLTGDKAAMNQLDLNDFGHIGVDDYYHQRTLVVFERMKYQAFWLTFLQGGLESSVLLLGTFGVLLSTFDQTELAMICLSLAASLQALERFHALSNRLDAANAGERDLINAWQEWSAMEPMQRRFQSNVNRLVLTTEGVTVALTSAATAGVRQTLATTKPN